MAGKTTAKERLAQLLKQGSSIPEVKEFKEQVRDVYSLGGPLGVDEWIEARRELGLLIHPNVKKAAEAFQGVIGSLIDEATQPASPAAPAGPNWEERQRLINEREIKSQQSVVPVRFRPPPHRKPKPKPRGRSDSRY